MTRNDLNPGLSTAPLAARTAVRLEGRTGSGSAPDVAMGIYIYTLSLYIYIYLHL